MGPTIPLPLVRVSVASITSLPDVQIGNSDIQITAVGDVRKWQTGIPCKGEHQILNRMNIKWRLLKNRRGISTIALYALD